MGRYITGDIDRKLWFAVQPSNAADRFGVEGQRPEELYYYFGIGNLKYLEIELERIIDIIGLFNLTKLKEFFDKNESYGEQMLKEAGLLEIWAKHGRDYADYELGCEIRDCIKSRGSCEFTAEM